jgi:hypothetical protein
MEVATEISISYNSKASSMFSPECVGGHKIWILEAGLQSHKTINRTGFHRSEQQAGLESRKTAIKLHRSAQQNKTKECSGAHYELCRSQV